jgi:hypothetical protein
MGTSERGFVGTFGWAVRLLLALALLLAVFGSHIPRDGEGLPLVEPEKGEDGSPRTKWSRIDSKYGKRAAKFCCSIAGYYYSA